MNGERPEVICEGTLRFDHAQMGPCRLGPHCSGPRRSGGLGDAYLVACYDAGVPASVHCIDPAIDCAHDLLDPRFLASLWERIEAEHFEDWLVLFGIALVGTNVAVLGLCVIGINPSSRFLTYGLMKSSSAMLTLSLL